MDFHTESKQRCLELIDRYFDLVTFPEFMPDQLTELKVVYDQCMSMRRQMGLVSL